MMNTNEIIARKAELLAAALAYARRDWCVTPLWWITTDVAGNRTCACYKKDNCRAPGKHPLFVGWRDSATINRDTIRFWWSKRPLANIGLVMGGDARLVAIDVDGEAGRESLAALEGMHGALPETWTQVSGRVDGGEHRVFAVPPELEIDALRNRVRIAPGIDVRATAAGFIVADPSEHISGGRYCNTINVSPADLPTWTYWILADSYKAAKSRMAIADTERPLEHELPSMQERVDRGVGICKHHPSAIEGENGSRTLMKLCVKLVRGLCLPAETALDLLIEHYNETCIPEWSEDELMHKLCDAEVKSFKRWRFVIDEVDEDLDEGQEERDEDASSADEAEDQTRRSLPKLNGPAASAAAAGSFAQPTTSVTAAALTQMVFGDRGSAFASDSAVQPWHSPSGLHAVHPSPATQSTPDANPDRISIGPPKTPPKAVLSYATVEVLGSITKDGQHHLQLRVLDGRLRGLKKDDPLDWPKTPRSMRKWQHISAALGTEITKPSDTYGKRFRAELLKRADGVVEVRRSYPAVAEAISRSPVEEGRSW